MKAPAGGGVFVPPVMRCQLAVSGGEAWVLFDGADKADQPCRVALRYRDMCAVVESASVEVVGAQDGDVVTMYLVPGMRRA